MLHRHLRATRHRLVAADRRPTTSPCSCCRRTSSGSRRTSRSASGISRRSAESASARPINGPFTFAPDGNPLVGPVRGLRNFWVACAVMAGFSQGGGIGLVLSRWMAEGDPGQDILSMDVARFGAFATPQYTSIKVHENYARRFRLTYPNEELPAARPLRRTPIYERLKAAGRGDGRELRARARAVVRAAGRRSPWRPRPIAARTPSRWCARSARRCAAPVGLYETTNYGKYEVTGRGARAWLDRVFACRIPKPGRLATRADAEPRRTHRRRPVDRLPRRGSLPDRRLRIRRGISHALVLARQSRRADVQVRSAASTLAGFSIAGPNARALLQRLVRMDLSPDAFRFFRVRETAVGLRTGDPDARRLHRRARLRGLDDAGLFGDALRRSVGRRARSRARALRRPRAVVAAPGEGLRLLQQGLPARLHARGDRARSLRRLRQAPTSPAATAALAERAAGPKRRFVIMRGRGDADADVVGYESILKDGEAVGYVTSGAFGHCVGQEPRGRLRADGAGARRRAFRDRHPRRNAHGDVRLEPLYDPQGLRLRG